MTYQTYRFVFPDYDTAVAVAVAAGVARWVDDTEQEPDEDGVYPQRLETTVTATVRETLYLRRANGDLVKEVPGQVVMTRRADTFFRGGGLQRQRRDAEGNLLWLEDTDDDGNPLPDMETMAGFHVDVLTNVPPETQEQQDALAEYAVDPTWPMFSFGEAA